MHLTLIFHLTVLEITQIMLRIIWNVIKSADIKFKFQNAYTCELYRHSH